MALASPLKSAPVAAAAVLLAAAAQPAVAAAGTVPSGPDLLVVRPAPAPVAPGGHTTLTVRVVNNGGSVTTTPFRLVIGLPPAATAAGPFTPVGCAAEAHGHTVTCTFPAGLGAGASETATIPVAIAKGTPVGPITGEATVALPGDPTPDDDHTTFTIHVV